MTTTIKRTCYLLSLLFVVQQAVAQSVGIGTTTPHSSALVDMNSSTKGILIPTMTAAQRRAIVNPATGLFVFQTNETPGFCYYNGQDWLLLTGNVLLSGYGNTITLAGNGTEGSADGTGTAATFNTPVSVAVDPSGNVYVTDHNNHKIRKITTLANGTSVVTTLAGSGAEGSTDGVGTAASFYYPVGVAADASGNVYVADFGNHKIRKITATGVVTTLAGSGIPGAADGTGTAASFYSPHGIAIDASGNLYVADRDNNKIRKIILLANGTGVVTTLAGSGFEGAADANGAAATFRQPHGIAADAAGNVYVADRGNQKIRKITPTGDVTTLAGSGMSGAADGQGTTASFSEPVSVAVDTFGNLYVADNANHKVRKITATGLVTTLAGSGAMGAADGVGAAAGFNYPFGVAVDATPGYVYVADWLNHKIRKIVAF